MNTWTFPPLVPEPAGGFPARPAARSPISTAASRIRTRRMWERLSELLEAHGLTVIVPPQRCCGIPSVSASAFRGASGKMGLRNIDVRRPGIGCGGDRYPLLLDQLRPDAAPRYWPDTQPPGAEAPCATSLSDICEFPTAQAERKTGRNPSSRFPRRRPSFRPATSDRSTWACRPWNCQLSSLGLRPAFRLDVDCCGPGGLYGFWHEKFLDHCEEIGKDLDGGGRDRMKPDIILDGIMRCRMCKSATLDGPWATFHLQLTARARRCSQWATSWEEIVDDPDDSVPRSITNMIWPTWRPNVDFWKDTIT